MTSTIVSPDEPPQCCDGTGNTGDPKAPCDDTDRVKLDAALLDKAYRAGGAR